METGQKTETTWPRKRGAHLTLAERGAIQCLRSQGLSLRQIAAQLACAHTTILKELRRGTPEKTGTRGPAPAYRAKLGQQTYQSNRLRCRRRFRVPECGAFIEWMSGQVRQHKWSFDACTFTVLRTEKLGMRVVPGCSRRTAFPAPRPCTTRFARACCRSAPLTWPCI